MCTVLLPLSVITIAVNKYIYLYLRVSIHIDTSSTLQPVYFNSFVV